jgi:hypothetical protein
MVLSLSPFIINYFTADSLSSVSDTKLIFFIFFPGIKNGNRSSHFLLTISGYKPEVVPVELQRQVNRHNVAGNIRQDLI